MMASIAADAGTGPPGGERTPFGGELEAAFTAHYRPLVRLASLLLDDVATCEEVVQDAFVSVWRRGPGLRDPDRLPAYLRSAVLNGARSQLRRRGVRRRHLRSVSPPPSAPPAEQAALAGDPDGEVLRALRALPDRQREVLALRYYLDLSEAEIAATLGISAGSVKTHAHRGLQALAEALEDRR
ncbi:MAG: RNA polymerase sigma factor [Actinomycetota bacterium]